MWWFFFVVFLIAFIGLVVFRNSFSNKVREQALRRGVSEEEAQLQVEQTSQPVPKFVNTLLLGLVVLTLGFASFNLVFFYAEPGYVYHVRTIFGDEKVVTEVGYNTHWFSSGRITPWKREMSIVSKIDYTGSSEDDTSTMIDDAAASAMLGPVRSIFLDQVDARVSATARFRLPTDEASFLDIARAYRSPANLVRTTLIPAFRETLQANAALMGAEEYFGGARNKFNIEFQDQLNNGLFIVERREVDSERVDGAAVGTANATLGTEQGEYGDDNKLILVVEKILDETGIPLRKNQSYSELGIKVVEARITDVVPNDAFSKRMVLKQQAAADRAIAREQRIQEEEQRLLAEAKGERQVAERRAAALVEQIQMTTEAETTKQLVLTKATQQKEQAEIDRETSAIRLEQARIDAETQQTLADATAYERRVIIEADNALAQKLETEQTIQAAWADAFAKRAVPQTVFVNGSNDGDTPSGGNTELSQMLQIMTMQMGQNLSYDRSLSNPVGK